MSEFLKVSKLGIFVRFQAMGGYISGFSGLSNIKLHRGPLSFNTEILWD
jgi:hypothetical protein